MPPAHKMDNILVGILPLIGLAFGQVGQVYVTYGSSTTFNATLNSNCLSMSLLATGW